MLKVRRDCNKGLRATFSLSPSVEEFLKIRQHCQSYA